MCVGPSTLGAGAKTRLESRIKKFTPHCVCRYMKDRTAQVQTAQGHVDLMYLQTQCRSHVPANTSISCTCKHVDLKFKLHSYSTPLIVKMACKQKLDLRCVLISDPSTLGAGAKTRLHTPKAVTYHEQPDYCRFMIGHSLVRTESRIKITVGS